MASPEDERMDALTEAILRLRTRQEQIEGRLARIEATLRISPAEETPRSEPARPHTPPPPPAVLPAPAEPLPAPTQPVPAPSQPAFETRMGLTWLNRIGVITLVLGVAFFFKYAVDSGWLGETARVLLGVAAGLAALGIGERFWRREQAIFAQGVSGAGIAILYVAFFASFGFYHLTPQPLAFVLMVLNTAAAGVLALRYDSPALAALGLLGGYVTPIVLSTGEDRPWALFGYVLLLNAGALVIGQRKQWRVLEWLAFAGTVVLYLSWTARFNKSQQLPALVFALVYYGLFVTRRNRVLVAVAQFVAMLQLAIWTCPNDPVRFLPLAAVIAAAALAVAHRRGWPETPLIALAAFWIIYAPAQPELSRHASLVFMVVLLTVAFGIFAAWLPWRVETRAGASSLELLGAALNACFYFVALYNLLGPAHHAVAGVFAIALAALYLAMARGCRDRVAALLLSGIALAFVTAALGLLFFDFQVTIAWALEAYAVAWIAARAREPRMVYASLAVFALALVRLLAIDAGMYAIGDRYTVILNPRFLTFLVTAAALWLSARRAGSGRQALGPYVTGHFVMLLGLVLEVFGWAGRNTSIANYENVVSTAVSMLGAAYAVALVGFGVARRSALDRALGLGLIALVVAKLYLYDVWRMSRGMYRFAAFAALGIFLLITSYLYSRYRSQIEALWRERPRR